MRRFPVTNPIADVTIGERNRQLKTYISRGAIRTTALVGLVTAFIFSLGISPANAASYAVTCSGGGSFNPSVTGTVAYGEGGNCLGEVTFDTTVTTIVFRAFYKPGFGKVAVTKYTIPQNVLTIADGAFYENTTVQEFSVDANNPNFSSLDGVLFNKSFTRLINYPGGKVTSYTNMPSTVTTIPRYAFYGAWTLPSLTIPASVTTIEDNSFWELRGTTAYNVDSNNPNFKSIDGVLFNKLGTRLINYPLGSAATSYIIPNTVTTIGLAAFHNLSFANSPLLTLTIPASVATVESVGVYVANITNIIFEGNAPAVVDSSFGQFYANPTATITQCATGFTSNGSKWPIVAQIPTTEDRLTIQVVNSSSCPINAVAPAPVIADSYRADNLGSVYFAPLSSNLSKAAKKQLEAAIIANPSAVYKITGYVQKSIFAKNAKNDSSLSLARAEAVETYLVSLGAGVTFTVVVDAGKVSAKNGKSNKARRATLFAMTPVVQ